jgi:hypothetical protein
VRCPFHRRHSALRLGVAAALLLSRLPVLEHEHGTRRPTATRGVARACGAWLLQGTETGTRMRMETCVALRWRGPGKEDGDGHCSPDDTDVWVTAETTPFLREDRRRTKNTSPASVGEA